MAATFTRVLSLTGRWLSLAPIVKALLNVGSIQIPTPSKVTGLSDQYRRVASLRARMVECDGVIAAYSGVEALPVLPAVPDVAAVAGLRQMETWVGRLRAGQTWINTHLGVEKIQFPKSDTLVEGAQSLLVCEDMARRLEMLKRAIDGLERQHTTLTEELVPLSVQLEAARSELRDMGVCPTCAQPYPEQPTGKGHDHAVVHLPD